jgi:hypothetical protein
LNKKKQKFKAKDQLQSFSPTKSLRNAAEKIVVRTLSPKPAAPLPTYELVLIFVMIFISLNCIVLQHDIFP